MGEAPAFRSKHPTHGKGGKSPAAPQGRGHGGSGPSLPQNAFPKGAEQGKGRFHPTARPGQAPSALNHRNFIHL